VDRGVLQSRVCLAADQAEGHQCERNNQTCRVFCSARKARRRDQGAAARWCAPGGGELRILLRPPLTAFSGVCRPLRRSRCIRPKVLMGRQNAGKYSHSSTAR
jgi:hypothetical protein